MAIKFKIPQRFDMGLAEEGVFFEVVDSDDNVYGSFKCRHIDQDNPDYKKKQERISTELTKANRNAKVDDETIVTELFVRAVLVDWKGIVDENDKAVPFSEREARDYFNQPFTKFVRGVLMERAQDARNYNAERKEDVAGN